MEIAGGSGEEARRYEGTITRLLVHVGDWVERHQDLFEISTDKVDTAIPAPVAGRVTEIRFKAGDIIPIHTVVVVIDEKAPPPSDRRPR